MTRIAPAKIDDLPDDVKHGLAVAEAEMGFVPEDALVMARQPELLAAFGQLVRTVFAPERELPQGLRRMIGLAVSQVAGCRYCQAHTSHSALQHDIDEDKLRSIGSFETSELFSGRERAALNFARGAGQSPPAVTDADFAQLQKFFSQSEIIEIIATISMFGFLNKWNSLLKTDIEALPGAALANICPTS